MSITESLKADRQRGEKRRKRGDELTVSAGRTVGGKERKKNNNNKLQQKKIARMEVSSKNTDLSDSEDEVFFNETPTQSSPAVTSTPAVTGGKRKRRISSDYNKQRRSKMARSDSDSDSDGGGQL